jgi:hypothetical protein
VPTDNWSVAATPSAHTRTSTLAEWRLPFAARFVASATAALSSLCFGSLCATGIALAYHSSAMWLLASLIVSPGLYLSGRWVIRAWRVSLTITPSEVVVVGFTRTHRVPLNQVDHFGAQAVRRAGANGTPMVVLFRHGADPIPLYATKREGPVWHFKRMLRNLDNDATELNLALSRARNSSP